MTTSVLSPLKTLLLWPIVQVKGWASNVADLFTELSLSDLVPPAVVDTIDWLTDQVPQAFGMGDAQEQMASSVVLAIASILTSLFSGGATLFFVGVFAFTFVIGALRLWPAIDNLWPLG